MGEMASYGERASDMRVYRCDVSSCGVERPGRKPQDAGFWTLTGPPVGFMQGGKRHFCSLVCIAAWVHMADPGTPRASDPAPRLAISNAPPPPIPVDLDAECEPVDVAPLYPDGDAPGRVTSARDWRPRRSSVSE
jgi:hypothetical protein